MTNFDDGILYNGFLTLDNKNGTACLLEAKHEVQSGDVVTKIILKKRGAGATDYIEQDLGVVYDNDLKMMDGRVLFGTMDNTGICSTSGTPNLALVVKELDAGLNNTNVVAVPLNTWNANVKVVENVGEIDFLDEEVGTYTAIFSDETQNHPDCLIMIPVMKMDADKNEYLHGYGICTEQDLSDEWLSNLVGDYVHFFANGIRYRVNMKTKQIDMLLFPQLQGQNMDFKASYTCKSLLQGMFTNMSQLIMNEIVQSVIDNTATGEDAAVSINPKVKTANNVNLYLELFQDVPNLNRYMLVSNVQQESAQYNKFAEVFKNGIRDVVDDGMSKGRLYGQLKSIVDKTFVDDSNKPLSSIVLVDKPSLIVRRADWVDSFTYEVVVDVNMHLGKEALDEKITDSSLEKKYLISNPTILGLKCYVKIVPKFTYSPDNNSEALTYDVQYGYYGMANAKVVYDQIWYVLDGKVRQKFIPQDNVTIDSISASAPIIHTSRTLPNLTNETIETHLEELFSNGVVETLFCEANKAVAATSPERLIVAKTEMKDNPYIFNIDETHSEWRYGGLWQLG